MTDEGCLPLHMPEAPLRMPAAIVEDIRGAVRAKLTADVALDNLAHELEALETKYRHQARAVTVCQAHIDQLWRELQKSVAV